MSITLSGNGIGEKKAEFEAMLAEWDSIFKEAESFGYPTPLQTNGQKLFSGGLHFYYEDVADYSKPHVEWICSGATEQWLQEIRQPVDKNRLERAMYGYVSPRIEAQFIYEKERKNYRFTLIKDNDFKAIRLESSESAYATYPVRQDSDIVNIKKDAYVAASGVSVNGILNEMFIELGQESVYNNLNVFINTLKGRNAGFRTWLNAPFEFEPPCVYTSTNGVITGLSKQNAERISIFSSIRKIGEKAFFNCNKIRSVDIPNCVVGIGSSAFEGCSSLEEILFRGSVGQWKSIEKGSLWDKDVPAQMIICTQAISSDTQKKACVAKQTFEDALADL